MEHLCRVELRDFREMEEMERFDKITGVGVIEHVGEAQVEYFCRVWRLLRPCGRFLNQGITTAAGSKEPRSGESFVDAYIFPDARLVPISRTVAAAEAAGFELRDIESLREHYAKTTSCWLERFEASQTEICKIIDEQMFRRFRLALAGFSFEFQRGRLNLYQTLLVKTVGGESGMPRTRERRYASGQEGSWNGETQC
jgi:cyclopropane-fatty-acyl-phospholipid synthase